MKSDEEFLNRLGDDRKLERRLAELANQRSWSVLMAIGLAVYISAHVMFVLCTYQGSISANTPFGFHIQPGMVLLPVLFLIGFLQCGVKAAIAHSEIRMLLLFKKLRDDKSVVIP